MSEYSSSSIGFLASPKPPEVPVSSGVPVGYVRSLEAYTAFLEKQLNELNSTSERPFYLN